MGGVRAYGGSSGVRYLGFCEPRRGAGPARAVREPPIAVRRRTGGIVSESGCVDLHASVVAATGDSRAAGYPLGCPRLRRRVHRRPRPRLPAGASAFCRPMSSGGGRTVGPDGHVHDEDDQDMRGNPLAIPAPPGYERAHYDLVVAAQKGEMTFEQATKRWVRILRRHRKDQTIQTLAAHLRRKTVLLRSSCGGRHSADADPRICPSLASRRSDAPGRSSRRAWPAGSKYPRRRPTITSS